MRQSGISFVQECKDGGEEGAHVHGEWGVGGRTRDQVDVGCFL